MSTTFELLQEAALRLTQSGSVKDRLEDAYSHHLTFVEAGLLPEDVRHEFDALREAMSRERPLPRETAVRASIRKMSETEAAHFSGLVVRMLCAVAGRQAAAPVQRQQPLAPIVQLFASEN